MDGLSLVRFLALGLLALPLFVVSSSAQEANVSDALADCSEKVVAAVDIPPASAADTIALCQAARSRLGFDPAVGDLQLLLKAAVVAQHNAHEHQFDLPLIMVGTNLLDIVVLRGLAADRDGFNRTLNVALKIDTGSKGVVSPGALLLQLSASGPLAKTMSDDGLIGFAALVMAEENEKVAVGSFASQQPLFAHVVGPWAVSGHIMADGALVMCQMSRGAEDGGQFAYSVSIGASTGGFPMTLAAFRTPTTMAGGAHPVVTVYFPNGPKFNLRGQVSGDTLLTELPSDPMTLQRLLEQFQHSKTMRVSTSRRGDAVVIDLADADAAFDANGQCLHDVLQRATAQMAR